jgi:Putative MetA-pathway of phenol degradation
MVHATLRRLTCLVIVGLGSAAQAQTDGSPPAPPPSENPGVQQGQTEPPTAAPAEQPESSSSSSSDSSSSSPSSGTASSPRATEKSLRDRIWGALSQEEDPDGPINTDRPTFTPANTVVPLGRLQFESGFTFNVEKSAGRQSTLYDLPELAMRYGLANRVEFRMFWLGPTDAAEAPRRGPGRVSGGISDMEVGFKWQLLTGDKERNWIPTTALITSATVPTSSSSALSSHTAEPYINLIYGWSVTEKLTLAGSTGYLGFRQQVSDASGALTTYNYQRFHQSLVAFYAVAERTTLFYEWYAWFFTNAADNLPQYFMDGGVLFRLTTNMQLDLRAGFGLTGRPEDFFTGAGFSVRF